MQAFIRRLSSSIVHGTRSTNHNDLQEINHLMQTYNQSQKPIRTLALFEWMTNITDVQPNVDSYQHIIRACAELNHLASCQKLQQSIQNDRTLSPDEASHLRIKLIYNPSPVCGETSSMDTTKGICAVVVALAESQAQLPTPVPLLVPPALRWA